MQKRLLLVSSLALSASLLLSSAIVPATAQEKNQKELIATSGWSVTRIDGNQSTPDSYCALSRQYDQGMVLTLGRNTSEEYSLALDFQKTKLNVDKAYGITLQPGPGQIRAYEMMPASQQALVVRLGYDDSFFKALQKSGFLKVEVDGDLYNFKMSDFDAGKKDLDGCTSGLKGGSATKVAKDFSAEKVADAPPMKPKDATPKPDLSPVVEVAPKPEPKIEIKKQEPAKVAVAEEKPKAATSIAPSVEEEIASSKTLSDFKSKPVPKAEKMVAVPPPTAMEKAPAKAELKTAEVTPTKAIPPKVEESKKPAIVMDKVASEQAAPKTIQPSLSSDANKDVSKASKFKKDTPPPPSIVDDPKEDLPKVSEAVPMRVSKPIEMARVSSQQSAPKLETKIEPAVPPAEVKAEPKVVAKAEPKKLDAVKFTDKQSPEDVVAAASVAEEKPFSKPGILLKSKKEKAETNIAVDAPKVATRVSEAPEISKRVSERPKIYSNNDSLLSKADISPAIPAPTKAKAQAVVSEAPLVSQTSLQKKQRDAVEQLKAENARLNEALKSQNAPSEDSAQMVAMRLQIEKLQNELAAQKTKTDPVDEQLKTDLEKVRSENEQLRLAVRAQAEAQKQADAAAKEKSAKVAALTPDVSEEMATERRPFEQFSKKDKQNTSDPAVDFATDKAELDKAPERVTAAEKIDPAVIKQMEALKSENARLSSALQGQEDKLAGFDGKSPEAEKELAAMREKLAELEKENKLLYHEARQAQGNIDSTAIALGNEAMMKIREYERKLEAAQSDNLALAKEIDEMKRSEGEVNLDKVAGNWDLEQATKRYNEAEREIKRLGLLLEQQRMAHREEKKELEGMLFDPAVTDEEQRRRLAELETQLAAAERELQASGRAMPAAINRSARPSAPLSAADERIGVSIAAPAPIVEQQRNNLEIQRLNNQVARQNQQIAAYSRQQQSAAVAPVQRDVQRDVPSTNLATRNPVPAQRPAVTAQPVLEDFGQNDIQALLNKAGVSVTGSITRKAPGEYRWNAGKLVGQAEVEQIKQAGSMDQFVQKYISKAKQSCGGDFASLPTETSGASKAYEIACISPTRSTSSSLVVTQQGDEVVVIAHETSAEDMEAAMDARDRIAASL